MSDKRKISNISKFLVQAGADSSEATEREDALSQERKDQTKENPNLPEGSPKILNQIEFVLGKSDEIRSKKRGMVDSQGEIDAYENRMVKLDKALSRLQGEWNEREDEERWGGLRTFFTKDAEGTYGAERAWNTVFNQYPKGHELHQKGFIDKKVGTESKKQEIDRLRRERLEAQLEFEDSRILTGQEDYMVPPEINIGKKAIHSRRATAIERLEDEFDVFQTRLEKVYGEKMPEGATGFSSTTLDGMTKGEWTFGNEDVSTFKKVKQQ